MFTNGMRSRAFFRKALESSARLSKKSLRDCQGPQPLTCNRERRQVRRERKALPCKAFFARSAGRAMKSSIKWRCHLIDSLAGLSLGKLCGNKVEPERRCIRRGERKHERGKFSCPLRAGQAVQKHTINDQRILRAHGFIHAQRICRARVHRNAVYAIEKECALSLIHI